MISGSSLTIEWLKPDLQEERWEFFNHPAKQKWYQRHSATWEMIEESFNSGGLTAYPRGPRIGELPVALSYHKYTDYMVYLAKAKRGYRLSYSRMEDALQSEGRLQLKAPIVLQSAGAGLLFSGYRRICLAWNYGMIPYVWLISLDRKQEI